MAAILLVNESYEDSRRALQKLGEELWAHEIHWKLDNLNLSLEISSSGDKFYTTTPDSIDNIRGLLVDYAIMDKDSYFDAYTLGVVMSRTRSRETISRV